MKIDLDQHRATIDELDRLRAINAELVEACERLCGVLREPTVWREAAAYGGQYALEQADITLARVRGTET